MGRGAERDSIDGGRADAPAEAASGGDGTGSATASTIPPPPPRVEPRSYGLSDVGCVRDHNEDSFLVADLNRSIEVRGTNRPGRAGTRTGPCQGQLLMVADGMGGHAAGEVASALTIDAVTDYALTRMPWITKEGSVDQRTLASGLRDAVLRAQERMKAHTREQRRTKGMGTTFTMAYVAWPDLFSVHVGDSRMYSYRDGQLHQVTTDHTLAQQLVDHRVMTASQAEKSDFSNVLVNALGGDSEEVNIELRHAQLYPGDILLLCSDGLTKHVDDDALKEALDEVASGRALEDVARDLIARAKKDGGTDNVTVVLATF
ncbi:MAG: PP2C family protein-serine/threonine phosphatase [Sandaracinaceae bacterium]